MKLTTPYTVKHEIELGLEVILLLVFMVADIYFMQKLLMLIFTKVLLNVKSKTTLALLFCLISAVLSAFLDALTVTAVIITVAVGFYGIYHRAASGKQGSQPHDHFADDAVDELHKSDLEQFRSFLRTLMMHALVGTALGGVTTIVGEPQNIIIAERAGWDFLEFFLRMAPVTIPVFVVGLLTCVLLEKTRLFGYGTTLPNKVRVILEEFDAEESAKRTFKDNASFSPCWFDWAFCHCFTHNLYRGNG